MKQLTLAFLFLLITGCTQNNGYIGKFFGQWQLKEIVTEDGTNIIDGTLFVCFQNEVVLFRKMSANGHESGNYIGTFVHKEDSLFMTLSHGDPEILKNFQIENKKNPSFEINLLDKKHFIISNSNNTWVYRKF